MLVTGLNGWALNAVNVYSCQCAKHKLTFMSANGFTLLVFLCNAHTMWRSDKCVYGWHITKPNLCLPSSFLVILPLCLLSPTYSDFFFPWHPLFTFSRIHIQWAWKINVSCGKLATVYICPGWPSSCRSGLVDTIVPYKYFFFLPNFSPMTYCLLVFHFWVMKGSWNLISIQFQTWWQLLWVCVILW